MPRRAGLYLRISEDRSGEGLAVDRQRQDGTTLITGRGWQLIDEYVDNDISASGRKRRPGFDRLLAEITDGRLDVAVAYSLDRLTRNARDRLALIDACRARNVLIALVQGSDIDPTTAAGRLYLGVLGEVAQHEIDVKSERHKRQVQQAAKAGLPGGGPRAFGYAKGGRDVEPREAEALREAYTRFLSGASLAELSDWFNRSGWTTPKGARWRPGTVRVVLANPRNAGLRGLRPVEDETTGRRSQWHDVIGPAVWPGIVDEPTWRAALAILRDPARRKFANRNAGGAQPRNLLSGLAVCGRCGIHLITSTGGYNGRRVYRCSSKMHIVRDGRSLDDYITLQIHDRLSQPDATDLLRPADPAVDLDALRQEAATLRARLDGLAIDYADGVLDREQVRTTGDRWRARLAEIDEQVARLGGVDVLAPLVLAEDEETRFRLWLDLPMSAQRAVVERVFARVVVLRGRVGRPPAGMVFDPDSVQIEWRDT